jgi:3-deoxy-manno-octulosonate cytidylyltransferase (CMP-KDO synthetase)
VIPYVVLIPARYASTRLPGKPLLCASGRYLVQHVQERALLAPGRPRAIVLTDDERIEAAVRSYGGEVRRTRSDHVSGTDRCAEAARGLTEEVVVNLQGDEPLVEPGDLARLAARAAEAGVDVATLGSAFEDEAGQGDPNAVKALVDAEGFAHDFLRERPPATRLAGPPALVALHHVGIYAFRRERLLDFAALAPTPRERAERLEQLRALEHGWRIAVLPASRPGFGIDTPADYAAFLRTLGQGA